MADARRSALPIRFDAYEVDLEGRQLRKHGLRIKLPDQPFELLSVLLERPGEAVTREELQQKLWASDTFVDFDRGLNKAMNRLRDALGDSADKPRYIETVPRRGYRFIGELENNPHSLAVTETVSAARPAGLDSLQDVQIESGPVDRPVAWTSWKVIFGAAAAVFIAVAGSILYFHNPPPQPQLIRSSLLAPPGSSFLPLNFALSPDGTRLAFSVLSTDGGSALWVRTLSSSGARRLGGTEGAAYPFWSPDGGRLGFFADRKLKTVDIGSGTIKALADTPLPGGGTWNRDGVIVFRASIGQPLYRVSALGGQAFPTTTTSREVTAKTSSWPWFLPDGKRFLYSVQWTVPGEASGTGLYVGSLESKGETLVSSDIEGNVTFTSGHLVFVREGRIVAQPFDPQRLRTNGPPVSLTEQEVETDTIALQSGFSVSQTGGLVFESAADFTSRLTWFDSSGRELRQISRSGYRSPTLSPDGRAVAVACDEAHTGRHSICVYDLERGVSTRITDGSNDASPIWSNDGREITYESRDKETAYLKRVPIDRSRAPQVLLQGGRMSPRSWLPDGRLLFSRVEGGARMYLASGGQTAFLSPGSEGQISPDGKWIAQAYSGVFVQSLAEPRRHIQITNLGAQPRWSHDGRELFYVAPDKKLMAVSFNAATGSAGAPRVLFPTRIIGTTIIGFQYDVAPDGRFLINSLPSNSSPLTLITGWTALLKH